MLAPARERTLPPPIELTGNTLAGLTISADDGVAMAATDGRRRMAAVEFP